MHKILIGLFFACLILPTQVYSQGYDYWLPDEDCKNYTSSIPKTCLEPRSAEEKKKFILSSIIYNNCYLSMLSEKKPDRDYKEAVEAKCTRISENPSFWDKIKYSD